MHLKSLEVQGFKSFPDKTVIQFGGDLTAIVGPNGSGKSNISDAILWVMGEQSTRTLRGAKMEDVIFGGTQKRAPVGFAEATLVLDNADRSLPYDSDEVMVTRRFYRSGDSEFYINRQSARLKDIHELFMDTGLGREGYSNVSQGRIDEILSLKSTDRRQVFEEAAGISKYRHRKEETERKLATTEDNLLRIGDKISELELQLEPLRQQSEKAKRYLALKAELRGLEVTVWLENLERLAAAAKKAETDYASSAFVLEQEHKALEDLYRKVEELAQELRSQDGKVELVRGDCAGAEASAGQIDSQVALLTGRVENNHENVRRIRQELSQQDDRSTSLDQQIQAAQERIAAIDRRLTGLRQELDAALTEVRVLTASAEGITKRYLELRTKESSLVAEIAGRQADIAALDTSAAQAGQRVEQLEEDIAAGRERRKLTQADLDLCRSALQQAREQVQSSQNAIAGYELRRGGRIQRRDELQRQFRECSGALDSVSARARVYKAMEEDYESYSKSVRSIMQESRRGNLFNIHGPVSRLIRTEDEFTTAIEIALGAAMQQIIVGNENDAKMAISFLKRTNGGRATFLPLSTVSGRTLQEPGIEGARGFVGIASRLVQCQDVYRPIVDNLLGRIVIVEDLDAAIAMSRQYKNRFKIVTLDGQVMNPGGSMTGGSVAKEAGILSRANELQRLLQEEGRLLQRKGELDLALREAQRAVDQTEYELSNAREKLRSAEDEVLRRQGEEKQHTVLLQALEDADTVSYREAEIVRNRMRSDRERAATLRGQLEALSYQLEDARRTLESLSQEQSDAARQSETLTVTMTQKKTEIAALEAERQSAGDTIDQLTTLSHALRGDRDKKLDLIQVYESDTLQLQEEIRQLSSWKQEIDRRILSLKDDLQHGLERRAETEAQKTRAEREAQDKSKSILTMERACALLEQKRATSALEERQVVDKLWDTYGLTPTAALEERVELESMAAANRQIGELKRKISAIGTPNLGSIDEYARVNERYSYLVAQRDDVMTAKRELESIIRDIVGEMTTIFVREFDRIDRSFQQTFTEMFGGGKGALVLENPQEPLTCGIEIRVQPPGKQLKTITLLSGGEKAFVAIALYFAILKVRPTPFCMLDEIDAALDDRNVERFAAYLHNLCQKTQFIVITHRRGTMELADVLYGVTMQEQGVSKILHMDLNQMEQELGIVE